MGYNWNGQNPNYGQTQSWNRSSWSSWGGKGQGKSGKSRKQRPYVCCANDECHNWEWTSKRCLACPKCQTPMPSEFDPSEDSKEFEQGQVDHLRGIQSYLSQLDSKQALVREIHTHINGLLDSSQADTATEEQNDSAAAWHAAKTRCAVAEQKLHKATGASEALAKKLARAKQAVVDIDAEATAHKDVLASAHDENLAAHKALRRLDPPASVEPLRKPPVAAPATSNAGKAPGLGWSMFAKFLEELSKQNVSPAGGGTADDMEYEDEANEDGEELRQAMAEAREKAKRVADLQQEQVSKKARQNQHAQAQAQQEHEQNLAAAATMEAEQRQAAANLKQHTEGAAAAAAQAAADDKAAPQANAAASAHPAGNTQQG